MTTATPGFIANSKEFHLPGFFTTIRFSPDRHRAVSASIHVFYPLCKFLNCSAPNVSCEVGVGADLLAHI